MDLILMLFVLYCRVHEELLIKIFSGCPKSFMYTFFFESTAILRFEDERKQALILCQYDNQNKVSNYLIMGIYLDADRNYRFRIWKLRISHFIKRLGITMNLIHRKIHISIHLLRFGKIVCFSTPWL